MTAIFISHNSNDAREAVALKRWLADNGWDDVFIDLDVKDGLSPGERWKDALKNAADPLRSGAVSGLAHLAGFGRVQARVPLCGNAPQASIVTPCNPKELPPDWQWCPLFGNGAQTTIRFDFRAELTECTFLADGLERLKNGLRR